MKAQLYCINNKSLPEKPVIGSFVFKGNESNELTGFVSDYSDDDMIEICLFEPMDIDDIKEGVTWSIPSLTLKEVIDKLGEALRRNPDMRPLWKNIL